MSRIEMIKAELRKINRHEGLQVRRIELVVDYYLAKFYDLNMSDKLKLNKEVRSKIKTFLSEAGFSEQQINKVYLSLITLLIKSKKNRVELNTAKKYGYQKLRGYLKDRFEIINGMLIEKNSNDSNDDKIEKIIKVLKNADADIIKEVEKLLEFNRNKHCIETEG